MKQFTLAQHSHYVFTPKMLTQCVFNLLNYPKDNFQSACVNELTNTFSRRLVDDTSVQKCNEIIRGQFEYSTEIDRDSNYFIPSGPKSLSFVCVAAEEWNESVNRNVAVCCKNQFINLNSSRETIKVKQIYRLR